MHTRQTTVHIAAEDAGEAATLCHELMVRGFRGATRSLTEPGLDQIDAGDILVIAGDFERMNGGERRLPVLGDAVRDRTIVFITRLRPADLAGPSLDPLSKESQYDPQSSAISSAYVAAFNDYVRKRLGFGEGRQSVGAPRDQSEIMAAGGEPVCINRTDA